MLHIALRALTLALIMMSASLTVVASNVITVPPALGGKDATEALRKAIEAADKYMGEEVEIRLSPAVYNISRDKATARLQHITNTTSADENPDPTKHYGIYLHKQKNITIDGNGAVILTHGEMTSIAIDSCENILIRNLTIKAADPSVIELRVAERNDSTVVCNPVPPTEYRIDDAGKLFWQGHGWEFTGGIAQLYNGTHTWRCESPTDRYTKASQSDGAVIFHYQPGHAPSSEPGQVYQLRHSFRTEVATFINRSNNVTLENVTYNFLGNFGIVGQFSRNVTLKEVSCLPDEGRTCAGFADFVQMSSCRGLVKIDRCRFAGAHDDPINVHGTHLKAIDTPSSNSLRVRYMHGQTFGFRPFDIGDEIALVDSESLLRRFPATVTNVTQIDDYEWLLTLDREITYNIGEISNAVVENVSANPEVEITGCSFTLTPTRGILLTTSGRCTISGNVFHNIPMSAILIADDARSWYESGPVMDVTIKDNLFIDCASPVINIAPENIRYDGPVHRNISITDNTFSYTDPGVHPLLISAKAADGLTIKRNRCNVTANPLQTTHCTHIATE